MNIKPLTLLLFIGLAWGQIDTLWTKIYGDTGSVPESGHYIKETQDGGYIVLGKNNQHLWLFKTDQNGIQEWSQLFGDTSEVSIGNSLIQTQDGGYVILGSKGPDIWLLKITQNGFEEWSKTYRDSLVCDSVACDGYLGNSIEQSQDGGFIITGGSYDYLAGYFTFSGKNYDNFRYQQLFLLKTDIEGNQEWIKTIDGLRVGFSIKQTTDNGYILTGQNTPEHVIFISKIDLLGNEIWRRSYGPNSNTNSGYSIEPTMDGGFITTGRWEIYYDINASCVSITDRTTDIWLHKIDSNGDDEWTRTFGADSTLEVGHSVKQTADEGFIICGYSGIKKRYCPPAPMIFFEDKTKLLLLKTNSLGEEQWRKTFQDDTLMYDDDWPNGRGLSIDITDDYGYIITGYVNMPGAGFGTVYDRENFGDLYMVRTSPDLSLQTYTSKSNLENFSLYPNYPNPFNPITTLRYDLLNDESVNITVYDMLGNVINELVNEVQNSGYKSIQWDATNYQGQPVSAGVYIYRIEAGGFRQTKKMILLK